MLCHAMHDLEEMESWDVANWGQMLGGSLLLPQGAKVPPQNSGGDRISLVWCAVCLAHKVGGASMSQPSQAAGGMFPVFRCASFSIPKLSAKFIRSLYVLL